MAVEFVAVDSAAASCVGYELLVADAAGDWCFLWYVVEC